MTEIVKNSMKRLFLTLPLLFALGCSSSEPPVVVEFRGNPISGVLTGTLRASGGPYLATDTLIVPAGQTLVIEAGTELRFEPTVPFLIYGKITAVGGEAAPITFTSGLKYPTRGDWDGIWMIGADDFSSFVYCRFMFGSKYGRHYRYREVRGELDSSVVEYGCLTLKATSPTIKRSWFLANGFDGIMSDSLSSPTVENCVFYDNAGHGIYVRWDAAPHINYNIIIENDDYGIYCAEQGEIPRSDLDANYNIVWSNFSGEFGGLPPLAMGRVAQTNSNLDSCDYRFNLRANPGFKDAELWDFRLTACSGAIDAGPASSRLDADGTRLELGIYPYTYRPGEIRRLITVPILEKAKSPYYMSCDVFLPAGQTLSIEPGVEVRVEGLYAFKVMGRLLSSGSPTQRIRFISAADSVAKGDWIGFILPSGGDAGSVFGYTDIMHTRWGIHLTSQDAMISHCTISESDSVGIVCENNSSPDILDTRLINNSIAGVLCQFNSSPTIRRCVINGGEGYGIQAVEASRPVISNCVFSDIGVDGVRLENLSHADIQFNVFARNGYYGLNCYNNCSPKVFNNIFYRNGSPLRGGVGVNGTRSSNPRIFYNCFWGNQIADVWISGDTTAFDWTTTVFSDPMFVNPEGGDFHLLNSSPCVGAGEGGADIGMYGGPEAG